LNIALKLLKLLEVIRSKDLSLENREVDLHLIKPSGMDWDIL
jgi:hypothetical protein